MRTQILQEIKYIISLFNQYIFIYDVFIFHTFYCVNLLQIFHLVLIYVLPGFTASLFPYPESVPMLSEPSYRKCMLSIHCGSRVKGRVLWSCTLPHAGRSVLSRCRDQSQMCKSVSNLSLGPVVRYGFYPLSKTALNCFIV